MQWLASKYSHSASILIDSLVDVSGITGMTYLTVKYHDQEVHHRNDTPLQQNHL